MIDVVAFSETFKRLEASKRLELLVSLLQMCNAFELRFVASVVEDLGRKDYFSLRESEQRCNNVQAVAQLGSDLVGGDSSSRGRLIVALSLLSSNNFSVATMLYKILLNLNTIYDQLPKTKETMDEIILLFVMAKLHPAFRFDQKLDIVQILERISPVAAQSASSSPPPPPVVVESPRQRQEQEEPATVAVLETPPPPPPSDGILKVDRAIQADEAAQHPCTCQRAGGGAPSGDSAEATAVVQVEACKLVYVANISVKGTRKTENEDVYDLQILWSNDKQTEASKTLREMYDFHKQLLDWYPRDAGACGSGRKIPYFPGYRDGSSGEAATSENVSHEVYDYIRDLVKLSPEILRSEYTVNFFKITSPLASPSSVGIRDETTVATVAQAIIAPERPSALDPGSSEEGDCIDAEGRVKSLTIYNSHVTPEELQTKSDLIGDAKTSPGIKETASQPSTSSSPGTSSRGRRKSRSGRSRSPVDKSWASWGETTSTTSQMSTTDLTPTVSTSSAADTRKERGRKSSPSSASSQSLVPKQLFSILKEEHLLEAYKENLGECSMEELCSMTESDLIKAELPLQPCLAVINCVKSHALARTKHLNGTILPKVNAVDLVGDLTLVRRSSPPVRMEHIRGDSVDRSDRSSQAQVVPTTAPVTNLGFMNCEALSVDTTSHHQTTMAGRFSYADVANGSSSTATSTVNANSGSEATTISSTIMEQQSQPQQQPQQQQRFQQHRSSTQAKTTSTTPDMAAATMTSPAGVGGYALSSANNEAGSIISAAYFSNEDEFPSIVNRSCSVDSSDPMTTAMMNFTTTSSSLPPSQSQSPAPIDIQNMQGGMFYAPTAIHGHMAASYPVQHGGTSGIGGNQSSHHQHHNQYHRNSKSYSQRPSYPPHNKSGGNGNQRRHYNNYDYSRPQQQQHQQQPQQQQHHPFPFMSAHSMAGHQMTIPAANFVRAPPPPPPSTSSTAVPPPPPQQRLRFVCQQCNGNSSNCPVCQGASWSNGLLTSPPGAPVLIQLTPSGAGGPSAAAAQLFPYLTSPPGNGGPLTAFGFGAPPPGYRMPTTTSVAIASAGSTPMVVKSQSATMISGDHQHQHHQQHQIQGLLDNLHIRVLTADELAAMQYMAMPPPFAAAILAETCCNCGMQGHTRERCPEPTMEDMTSSGHFHLNMATKEDSASTSQDH